MQPAPTPRPTAPTPRPREAEAAEDRRGWSAERRALHDRIDEIERAMGVKPIRGVVGPPFAF